MRANYDEEAQKLVKAIDIAIEAFTKYPPRYFTPENIESCIKHLNYNRTCATSPREGFRTLKSLRFRIEDVFTFFNEGQGEAVEYFWKRIVEQGLDYTRKDKMQKILKRGRIINDVEFDYVTDVMVAMEQEKLITEEQLDNLKRMIGEYESRKR